MRILLITEWFQPEPFLKGLPFAKELAKLGHEVQVLTGFPNYPGGKLYDGYRVKFFQKEIIDGITVLRMPLYPSHDSSGIRRFLTYMSFALSAAIIGTWSIKRPDVVYVYLSPITTCIPACIIRLFRRTRLVYDIQDLWPDAMAASGMFKNKLGLWFADKCCRMFYRAAAKIVVLSPGYKRELVSRGVPDDKIDVIYNWCSDAEIAHPEVKTDTSPSRQLGLEGRFNVIFAGTMGKAQALDAVLDAAAIVQKKCPQVQFVFIGGGIEVDNLKKKSQVLNLANVLFLPRKPFNEIGSILQMADVLLVHLKDEPLFRITIPSKTQAYMAVGKPILMGVKGDAADLIKHACAGVACEPENPQSIAEAVIKFQSISKTELEEIGANARKFYNQELSLKIGTQRFIKIFEMVAASFNA